MIGHPVPGRSKEDVLTAYRRDALLKAAVRVFGESGFDSATMERIAQEADVAKGTTYLYYRSKQTIYDAALGSGLAELSARTQADPIPRERMGNATSLFNLMRNLGGGIGIATTGTLLARNQQEYVNIMGAHVTPYSPAAQASLDAA